MLAKIIAAFNPFGPPLKLCQDPGCSHRGRYKCPSCAGRGRVFRDQNAYVIRSQSTESTTCERCGGSGHLDFIGAASAD